MLDEFLLSLPHPAAYEARNYFSIACWLRKPIQLSACNRFRIQKAFVFSSN